MSLTSPNYYKSENGNLQALDVIYELAGGDFCLGNAIKYLVRIGKKGDAVEDALKAIWYIQEHLLRQYGVELNDVDLHHKH